MSRLCLLLRSVSASAGRLGGLAYSAVENALLGSDEDEAAASDPIMEVVAQNPHEAICFIKVVMLFGALTGLIISAPCAAYLTLYWAECSCSRPLQGWIAGFTALQIPQLPVRYLFFIYLSTCPSDRRSILQTVRRMTSGPGWRCSKALSILSYGWFILGVAWVFNSHACEDAPGLWRLTVSAIVVSMVRLAATFVCFWVSFPPPATGEGMGLVAPVGTAVGLWRRGATPDEIRALPRFRFGSSFLLRQLQQQQLGDLVFEEKGDPCPPREDSDRVADLVATASPNPERPTKRLLATTEETASAAQKETPLQGEETAGEGGGRSACAPPAASSFSGCVICLSDFSQGDWVRLLRCRHCFHQSCIDVWLSHSRICPLCLRPIHQEQLPATKD